MNNSEYIEKSARTVSKLKKEDCVVENILLSKLKDGAISGVVADATKREIFYKDVNAVVKFGSNYERVKKLFETLDDTILNKEVPQQNIDIYHGILGLLSETSEIIEAYVNGNLSERGLDYVNIGEECGDLLWYIALILRSCDMTFDDVMSKNIAKLQIRFPDKFTTDSAINRNLDEERKVLEQ
jgi:NTP pyrophosphatase (non-canonical NTP hydrolase)